MGPLKSISTAIARTFTFSGRASRAEYWWFFALYTAVCMVCVLLDGMMVVDLVEQGGEAALATLGVFAFKSTIAWLVMMPTLACVTVRRLHDAGFSGFWLLLYLVPLGGLVLLILHMLPSQNSTTVHGSPAGGPVVSPTGKPMTTDAHKRAMQGYALLFDKDKKPTPEMEAARKAEIKDYYQRNVLKPAATV